MSRISRTSRISRIFVFAIAFVFVQQSCLAQQKVTGTVIDENGDPVIGATVVLSSNSKKGTVTDLNGRFSIDVPDGAKLKVSYIGYKTQMVTNLKNPKIIMREDGGNLNEVVVVGYGALKQKNVTGSVEIIDTEELRDLNVTSLSEALAGISPSIHVSLPSTGRPGENATITIRQAKDAVSLVPTGTDAGGNAIGGNASASPLYVIDDFISSEDDFNNLDIDEVESISVLKDGEAAIYGAYGAYGVILVKTKRGKAGKPKISYQFQLGVTDALKHADMLSGQDYAKIYNAAQYAPTGKDQGLDNTLDFFQSDEIDYLANTNYNLLDKYWKSSSTQRHSLNMNGGTEAATYFGSVSYQTQDGNIGKLDYQRWNYRAGINANIGKYFKATLAVSGDNSKKDQHMAASNSEEDYVYMLKNPSYVPDEINGYSIYNSGMKNDPSFNNYYNYSSMQKTRNNKETTGNGMTIQGTLQHDFSWWKPLRGLTAKLTYSRNVSNSKVNSIKMENTVYRVKNRGGSGGHLYITDPTMIIDNGTELDGYHYVDFENLDPKVLNSGQSSYIQRSTDESKSYQLNFQLNYARKFGDHDVSGMFGIEKSESESEDLLAKLTHPLTFTDGQSNSVNSDTEKTTEWNRSESGSLAYISRINYAYKDKYLFQFLMRTQASTKFAPKNYWGWFPGVSAGWVISEEPWFNNEKLVNFLKIRGSFGIMGRDNVDAWRWLQLYDYTENRAAIFGTTPDQESGRAFKLPEKSGTNYDLHWDTNYKTNFGVDLRALDSRLSLSLDMYYDFGRDMFDYPGAVNQPGTVGIYAAPENYAQMDMWGGEIVAGWRQKFSKDMYLSAKLGFAYDDNKVLRYFEPKVLSFTDKVIGERADRGTWGYSCIGMFRSYQEIDEYFQTYNITKYMGLTKSQVQPGMLIYEDIRGARDDDGNYTAPDGIIDSNDMVQISKRSSNPYNANLNLNFVWKDFSINATMQAEWGSYTLVPSSLRGEAFEGQDGLQTKNISSMWTNMFVYEDYYIQDANGEYQQVVWANPTGSLPNIKYSSVNSVASTFWRMSGTEIYLRNITLAWTLPRQWVKTIGLSNVRLNVTCQNALSFYNPIPYKAWDNFAGTYGKYPSVRKITMGLNVTF